MFDFVPWILIICKQVLQDDGKINGSSPAQGFLISANFAMRFSASSNVFGSSMHLSWSGGEKTVFWYSTESVEAQGNLNAGNAYYYVSIG